jgi:hypothetical protein
MIAYAAMIVGPGIVGSAISSADGLFGIDVLDIFCHNRKKCDKRDPGLDLPQTRSNQIAGINMVPQGVAGNGGESRSGGSTARASSLPPVPTAPSARSVVIRDEPPASAPVGVAPAPIVVPPPVIAVPVVAPLAPPAGVPSGSEPPPAAVVPPVIPRRPTQPGARQAVPTSAINAPAPQESFRVGYADVLRGADMEDLIIAAVPGVSGMVALTAAGAMLGYRQARAAQAVRATAIARFMR